LIGRGDRTNNHLRRKDKEGPLGTITLTKKSGEFQRCGPLPLSRGGRKGREDCLSLAIIQVGSAEERIKGSGWNNSQVGKASPMSMYEEKKTTSSKDKVGKGDRRDNLFNGPD